MIEFDFTRDRWAEVPLSTRLALGVHIAETFMSHMGSRQEEASSWLKQIGFEGIEWVSNHEGDLLFLLLWRMGGKERFIITFGGYDALTVRLWTEYGSREVV
jgi:hypothetical protein